MDKTVIEQIGGCKRIIAILTTIAVLSGYYMGVTTPDEIINAWLLIVGTYFGASIANSNK